MSAWQIEQWRLRLGIPADYGTRCGTRQALPRFTEARDLVYWGKDMFQRPRHLQASTAEALNEMLAAAAADGHTLQVVSAFRSIDYQGELIEKRLSRGDSLDKILKVNVAPGYSEHHTGCAVDLSAPGFEPLEPEFDASAAFAWLMRHAARFQFSLSYPRDNPYGLDYEPWHWRFKASSP